ncbi:hypothetical protein AB1Y20_016999 [Prymnesium parvum]|uniref:DNA replication licensing factor MCM3 n=1 Tax=Prymnesium parvum TaxID=97485 RepID=A0AB34IB04_PRYPA
MRTLPALLFTPSPLPPPLALPAALPAHSRLSLLRPSRRSRRRRALPPGLRSHPAPLRETARPRASSHPPHACRHHRHSLPLRSLIQRLLLLLPPVLATFGHLWPRAHAAHAYGAAMTDPQQVKSVFNEFLDQRDYMRHVNAMSAARKTRLMLSIDELRSFDAELTRNFMRRPAEYLPLFEEALRDAISAHDPSYEKHASLAQLHIGLQGSFGAHHVSPRGLGAPLLNQLVCVEGIVTKCSLVRPKVLKSAHYCEATGRSHFKEYRDLTSLSGAPTGSAYLTRDADGHVLSTEYGLCEYLDHQQISLQEMPERAPPGQLPRSVDVLLENDLVDLCKPGDRVQVVGIHRALPSKSNSSGMFNTLLLANHVRPCTKELASDAFTREDVLNIKTFSKREDVVDMMTKSLAPSICGHTMEKTALLLMLLGGHEKNLSNGTHLRGDINILMLGDPSTAKSQLLRFVLRIAPLAVSTTGRGSSGVGLTAAVTSDEDTGERRLEAGAMVLADRGVCCVDEFDKMLDADRVAIHEVMEQQTVTISKAGIHASLNARCSVVAAANPVYGQYDPNRTPMQNIGLPDSLLSRFDLLFIILDSKDPDHDRKISKHVLRMHSLRRTVPPPAMVGMSAVDSSTSAKAAQMFVRVDAQLLEQACGRGRETEEVDAETELLSADFIKKYIQYAKTTTAPQMSEAAAAKISQAYAALRTKVDEYQRTLPVTARTLETIIRLATAHAKLHLRGLVGTEDADFALELLYYALFKEKVNGAKTGAEEGAAESAEEEDEDDLFDIRPEEVGAGGKRKRAREEAEGEGAAYSPAKLHKAINEAAQVLCFSGGDDRSCTAEALLEHLQRHGFASLSLHALDEAIASGVDSDRFMYVDGELHVI